MKLKIKDGLARVAASKFTTGEELAQALEAAIKKHFPKSMVSAQVKKMLGDNLIYILFTVAGSKAEVLNGILENDISLTKIHIDGIDASGNLQEMLELRPVMGGSVLTNPTEKHMAFGRLKVGLSKKKGTPEQILKHVDSYFGKLAKAIKDNADKIPERHKEILKSISLASAGVRKAAAVGLEDDLDSLLEEAKSTLDGLEGDKDVERQALVELRNMIQALEKMGKWLEELSKSFRIVRETHKNFDKGYITDEDLNKAFKNFEKSTHLALGPSF